MSQAPAWSRSIPPKLPGLYWMRNHGGSPAITYIDRWNDAWSLNGARTELTQDYLATQDSEFWTEEVHPPTEEAKVMGQLSGAYGICLNELNRVMVGEKPYPPGHHWPELPEPTDNTEEGQ